MHCFVCHEETAERCACACKAHVHREGLLKTIEVRQNTNCSICAQRIQNVAVQTRQKPSIWALMLAIALLTPVLCSCVSAMLLLALAVDERNHAAFYDLLICCASSLFLAMFASHFLQKLLQDHQLSVSHEVYQFV